jgi:hypothetical protein
MLWRMRITVTLDDDLLLRAKRLAARQHRTLTSVLEDALRAALSQAAAAPRRRHTTLPVSTQPPGLLPGVNLDDAAGLLGLMERRKEP